LVEVLTATAIMSLLVSLVMVILTQVMTAWNSSSEELTFSMNAHAVFDIMAQDLQGCILRSDGNQWLSLTTDFPPTGSAIPALQDSRFIFFTSTPKHLSKDFAPQGGVGKEIAGDICAVEYRVTYADPFGATATPGSSSTSKTFSLHRVVVDPASTFYGVNNVPIMGLNSATNPSYPGLKASFDTAIDLPASTSSSSTPLTSQTPMPVAIPYGGSQGPSALTVPIYGAYSTANRLLDNVGQFTVFLYFTGLNPAPAEVQTIQTYPQTAVNKSDPPAIYYGGSPTPTIAGGYLDALNDTKNPPVFLSLAYADITLSILTDDGIAYLQQNNGAVPQGFTWPKFLQKFSRTYTERVPILVAPH
jgi:hypothetical protein